MDPTRTRRKLLIALGGSAVFPSGAAVAPPKADSVPRIAYLSTGTQASNGAFLEAFRSAMRDFGYVDGQNLAIDVRWVGGAAYEFPQVAASMVKTNPSAIIGTCIPSTRAAKNATSTIPVVMAVNGDPIAAGLIASLAHPGGNVTGTTTLFEELIPKWLEFLRQMAPGAGPVAVLVNPASIDDPYWWGQIQVVAGRIGVNLVRAEAKVPEELPRAFASIKKQSANSLVVMDDPLWTGELGRVVALSNANRLPAIYGFREFVDAGGLMSYGISFREYYRDVASYVVKVLKGARPTDLPVDQPTKIELAINVTTAKKLGIKIPDGLLVRADKLVD